MSSASRCAIPWQRWAEYLAAEGLARGGRIVPRPNLLATLRRPQLDAAEARLSAETGLPYRPAAGGEMDVGTDSQRIKWTSGRLAMIDNDLAFVPWTPALERHLSRHVTAIAKESGEGERANQRMEGVE